MAIKRMNYFNGEFLKEDDFKVEQQYHVDMLRAHNRSLHSWGIANGLDIFKIGERKVTIKKGMAIDASGRQIIVEADIEERISDYITAPELYVTISYDEVDTDPIDDITGVGSLNTRTEEKHLIEFLNKSEFEKVNSSTPMKIFLARVILDNNKTISDIDSHGRKYAGTKTENYAIKFDSASGHKHTGRPDDGPVISHSDLNGVLPANTNSTDTTANKHVSDDLAKSWQDHISITSGNPHGTTAAQLSDYLGKLHIVPVLFTNSDKDGETRKINIGFVPKLIFISGGFSVMLGGATHGSTFSGFWADGQSRCSYPIIHKHSSTDIQIRSQMENDLFRIYIQYDDITMVTKPLHEIISGSIDFSSEGVMKVTLNRKIQGSSAYPIDSFDITLSMLCIG